MRTTILNLTLALALALSVLTGSVLATEPQSASAHYGSAHVWYHGQMYEVPLYCYSNLFWLYGYSSQQDCYWSHLGYPNKY